jgi:PAS domain S-box-containing protein
MQAAQILVVEDEAVLAMDLERHLQAVGYRIAGSATSGDEAVRLAEQRQPDLVLMDIMLRGKMDGVEAARHIRAKLDIPVVYLTAYSDSATVHRAKASEPFAYVLKPFEERELAIAIELALYRHQTERRLKKLERWLSTTLGSIGDGVIATDLRGIVTYLNPMAERLTGWKREEAQGRDFEQVFHVVKETTRESAESLVTRTLREGIVIDMGPDCVLVDRQGREVAVDDSAAPLRDDSGRLTGVVVVFRDVTQRKRGEREFRESQELLRQSQKMEAVGRLAGGVAHDFNNLLGVILGYSQLVLAGTEVGPNARSKIEQIQKATERAAELTRQLLAYSRRQVLKPRVVDLNEVLGNLLPMLHRLLGEDILIQFSPTAESTKVFADVVQLEQVMMNLAVNSRDAMPTGGRLTLETESVVLDEAYAARHALSPGRYVKLAVADTGSGMDAETLSRVFEPYFTTKVPGSGTGLGLATVLGIVKQSRGHIEITSSPGAGTTSRVYLPCVQALPDRTATPPTDTESLRGRETVLLVEDDEAFRTVVWDVLESLGYRTLVADSSQEALRVCRKHPTEIDLVLTDVVMPEMGGPDLARQLLELRPALKIVFMSGYSEAAVARYGLLGAGAGFVQKPFTIGTIAAELRRVLDGPSAQERTARASADPGESAEPGTGSAS